jgi:hypothetical protein
MFQTKLIQKIKTHFLFSHHGYDIMLKNMVQADEPQMKIKQDACALHDR